MRSASITSLGCARIIVAGFDGGCNSGREPPGGGDSGGHGGASTGSGTGGRTIGSGGAIGSGATTGSGGKESTTCSARPATSR